MARRPLVFGHRGASATRPENTLAAFAEAFAVGADGVELDVQQCASGEIVVFHDAELARLTGALGSVEGTGWGELSRLRVHEREPIPLLDQVLGEDLGAGLLNIEVKSTAAARIPKLVTAVVKLVRRHRAEQRTIVSSFDPRLLAGFRVVAPELERALLCHARQGLLLRGAWLAPVVGAVGIHPEHVLLDRADAARWRRRGYRIRAWTVNSPERVRALAAAGVHALISDDPGQAVQVVRAAT